MEFYITEEGRKRQIRWFKVKLYGGLFLATAALAGGFYVLNYTDFLQVSIETQGNQRSRPETVLAAASDKVLAGFWGQLLGFNNYFSWPSRLDVQTPLIASVEVHKELFKKKIILVVQERQPYGVFCGAQRQCYWFDKQGVLFEPAPVPDGPLIIKVLSDAKIVPAPGKNVIAELFRPALFSVLNFFEETKIGADRYEIKTELQEIQVHLLDGVLLRLSLRFNPDASLRAIQSLQEKGELKKVFYVDATVENRLYLKPK